MADDSGVKKIKVLDALDTTLTLGGVVVMLSGIWFEIFVAQIVGFSCIAVGYALSRVNDRLIKKEREND